MGEKGSEKKFGNIFFIHFFIQLNDQTKTIFLEYFSLFVVSNSVNLGLNSYLSSQKTWKVLEKWDFFYLFPCESEIYALD